VVTAFRSRIVLAITGSRADWGLLAPPLALLRADPAFALKLLVTGQHLAPEAASSLAEIEADGFLIDERIDMHLVKDTAAGIIASLGHELFGLADVFARPAPDLLLVLGDRYEILVGVTAALMARIPVVHLCGGDVTEGAFDDAIRHAITKLSHVHLVTNEEAARRVRQMGENPAHVHNVGSPGLDRIRLTQPMERDKFFGSVALIPRVRNAIVTFHPTTLAENSTEECRELLAALDSFGPDLGLIFTGVNADPGAQALTALIETFVDCKANAVLIQSMGSRQYFSALTHVDAAIGNSSSGIYEVPSFGIPTINVGTRQNGRIRAASIIDCEPERNAIRTAITHALSADFSSTVNPYGDGYASERILRKLKEIDDPAALLVKRFHYIGGLGP
jgi:UDP-hydrolysing UDP-N-acetyl-D-glucosamine 2-epimerase